MKLLLITGPPVLNLCAVSLVGDEWSLCARPDWHLLLLLFSLSMCIVRQDKVILSDIHECWTLCSCQCQRMCFNFYFQWRFYCVTNEVLRRIIKHQSRIWSIQRVVSPTPLSPCPSFIHTLTRTHTHLHSQSLWASPQVLGYSVKQLEWAQKSQKTVCALDFRFTLKFPRLTGTEAAKPDSCEGLSSLCQDCDFCGVGGAVWKGKATCCLSCSRTLLF